MPFSKAVKLSLLKSAFFSIIPKHNFLQANSRHRQGTIKYILLLILFFNFIAHTSFASAHQVKTTGDVGATLHIEPNDTPRAGEAAQAWFALTRKGGKVIQLAECNCKLNVFAKPFAAGEPPLLEPKLQSVTAERYKGVPGTEITFPRPGAYQLQLRGQPKTGTSFKPFDLKFDVTVAAGTAIEKPQNVQNVNQNITQGQTSRLPIWAIASFGIIVLGVLLLVRQRGNRG